MNRDIVVGRTDDDDLVLVQLALHPLEDRDYSTVDHRTIPAGNGKRLSITGLVYAPGRKVEANILSEGQCTELLLDVTQPKAPWTLEEVKDLHDIWRRWHLNDMRAGCVHQTKLVWEDKGTAGGSTWLALRRPTTARPVTSTAPHGCTNHCLPT